MFRTYALIAQNRWLRIANKVLITILTIKNAPAAFRDYLKLSPKPFIYLQLFSGFSVKVRSNTVDSHEAVTILSGQEYPFQLLKSSLSPQGIILDIGAHLGSFTIYLKSKQPNLRIYCFEPAPDNFSLLSDNIKDNRWQDVEPLALAVSGHSGHVLLETDSLDSNAYSLGDRGLSVPSIDLDSFIEERKISQIDLIKMDCEGAEYDILANFKKINAVKAIILEYHNKGAGKDDNYVIDLLVKQGFILADRRDRRDHSQGLLYFQRPLIK